MYVASKVGCGVLPPDGRHLDPDRGPHDFGHQPAAHPFRAAAGTPDETLLVGSDGYGYYPLPTTPIGSLTRFPTTTSDLYTAAVQKLYFDRPENRVFACTSMGGLWRGAVTIVDGSITWNLE